MNDTPALVMRSVGLVEDGTTVLDGVDWQVGRSERWVVLGANGSGKTSLIRVASLYRHPSSGTVTVLGETLGSCDVRRLRKSIGLASPALTDLLEPGRTAAEIVVTGREAALAPWWHTYREADHERARAELARWDLADRADHRLATLSAGERQRVLLARAFAFDPAIVLLDEPTAGLDLPGREDLVHGLAARAATPDGPPTVLVTHHVEEIPPGFTHAMLMQAGTVAEAGAIDDVLTSETLSQLFERRLFLDRVDGRWSVRGVSR
jgi:iron complex transport system ATP-binding protein